MAKKGIIYFLKYPLAGQIKSRLAKEIGTDLTLKLYQCFITDTLNTLSSLKTEILIFVHPPESVAEMAETTANLSRIFPQTGANIGERMNNAFIKGFKMGFDMLVLIGADLPDLAPQILIQSLNLPGSYEVVLGPATDGGYYLIGFWQEKYTDKIFSDKDWGSATVYSDTLKSMQTEKLKVHTLPGWSDIDGLEDLRSFYQRNQTSSFKHSATMSCIGQNLDAIFG